MRFAAAIRAATLRFATSVVPIASIAVAAACAVAVHLAAGVMRFGTIAIGVAVRAFAATFEQAFLSASGCAIATAATAAATTPPATATARALAALALSTRSTGCHGTFRCTSGSRFTDTARRNTASGGSARSDACGRCL